MGNGSHSTKFLDANKQIIFWVKNDEKKELDDAADILKISRSKYIRQALRSYLETLAAQ